FEPLTFFPPLMKFIEKKYLHIEKKNKKMPKRDYTIDLRHTKPVTLSVVIFLLTAGIAMGALAFLQFTDWIAAFYVFAALPLPISMIFLITKIIIPTLNKSKKDDKKVSIIAFVIYYFSTFIGWAMIWMIIW